MLSLAVPDHLAGQACRVSRFTVSVGDSAGSPIDEAQVRIQAGRLGASTAATGADGLARFNDLNCGAWVVGAAKDGFEDIAGKTVQLDGDAPAELALTLTPRVVHYSVDVRGTAAAVEQTTSDVQQLHRDEVKDLPSRPASVADTLPLTPGVFRSPDGEIRIGGAGEHRSAFVVNQVDVTDPATGDFGWTVPIDSVEAVNVLTPAFLAQYGGFTSGVVDVETRRGGDKWHADLNNPFPDFSIRSWHVRGVRGAWPRAVFGGALIANRMYFIETFDYDLQKTPNRTLLYPYNLSKSESVNSFTQLDYVPSPQQFLTTTFHLTPRHTNFVDPSYFNPQPVTPNYAQRDSVATVADHLAVRGLLVSTLSIQRFDATVGTQGPLEMILTPIGNRGNYFSAQHREAGRAEWLESWSSKAVRLAGTHEWRLGSSLARTSDDGRLYAKPVQILSTGGGLLRRIDFTGGGPYHRTDLETAVFAQDRWTVAPGLFFDLGARLERQNIVKSFRIAPRGGLAWTPIRGHLTVIRAGYGIFYDRVPLSVFTFESNPRQTIADYAPDGSLLGPPLPYVNIVGRGDFGPRSVIWNAQIDQPVSHFLKLHAVYTDNHSRGLVVFHPQLAPNAAALTLNGDGRSRYWQAEFGARFALARGQHFFVSYTHSRARGSLNDFSALLGSFPNPLIRPDAYSNLPGDLPDRFLCWGRVNLPWKIVVLPTAEFRSGLPYATLDALGNYAGVPNSDRTRFPAFFSLDARVMRDIKLSPKYTLRLSGSGGNLTHHFNPVAVHANIADPSYGIFFGENRHLMRADSELVF